MRASCNGCRVLRKGCSEDCSIRPCLLWLKNPEWQGNATLFLAKFYGRAGLHKLIDAGPEHLRPAIFRSLLYEACGRIVDPINGSAGLLSSGCWHLCQATVNAVLKGGTIPVVQMDTALDGGGGSSLVPPRTCDIRHFHKNGNVHVVSKASRRSFKRPGIYTAAYCSHGYEGQSNEFKPEDSVAGFLLRRWPFSVEISHELRTFGAGRGRTTPDETPDGSMVTGHEDDTADAGGGAELDLTLTLNMASGTLATSTRFHRAGPSSPPICCHGSDCSDPYANNLLRLSA